MSTTDLQHQSMANSLRFLAMDAVEKAKSGHPGMPMGMADVATVLFRHFLKFDPTVPEWPDRDRFVLSAGHGCMLLYALLHLTGYEDMPLEELKQFRQWGSRTAGHPEYGAARGIETSTGPLGQGISNAVGMALAERILAVRFGDDLVNHRTYVIASDGDLMEGISHEAISLAGHLGLGKLIVLFDDNHISIDGPTSLAVSDDQLKRFEAAHWFVQAINGHDEVAIYKALEKAQQSDRPSFIACRTTIGFGAPTKAGTAATHGAPLGGEEIGATRGALDWPHKPFEIPSSILDIWRNLGAREARLAWEGHLKSHSHRQEFERCLQARFPEGWEASLAALKQTLLQEKPTQATRILSQRSLDAIAPHFPELVGGSADLTGSNNTKAKSQKTIDPDDFSGQYIHYGVREHGMAAMMNGLALHKGIIPYGGTFLVFSDYMRPAIRLSALMEQRVIYVLTHDSIGLGEDGPTHQPIEHLAALRAIPNLNVFRPADGIEVAECWERALKSLKAPSIIVLTRQNLLPVRTEASENLSAKGGYILREAKGPRIITLLATGSEVSLACQVHEKLVERGIAAAVVSLPCWRLFDQQSQSYRDHVLGPVSALRVAIEAASPMGWERYIGFDGLMIGMTTFGASAPFSDLFENFGFTPSQILKKIEERLR